MKKRFFLAFVLTAAAGGALHFLYPLCPSPLTAILAPVNESVWEHLKMLFWPFLAAAFFLVRKQPDRPRAWSAFLAALLSMPPALTAAYYLLKGGFGAESVWLDLALYILTLAFGFALSARLLQSGRAEKHLGLLIALSAIFGVALTVFSFAAPPLPIFTPSA